MKSAFIPLIVFFSSLALNWSIKTEFPEKNGNSGVDTFYANTFLVVGFVIIAITFIRKSISIVHRKLIYAGVLHEGERLISWRYALLAPLPCLFMFRYSWIAEDSKRVLEYGGSTSSTFAYGAGVAALIAFQLKERLSKNVENTKDA